MQNFQTAATVLTHRLPHSAKPHARILPQRGRKMTEEHKERFIREIPAVADAAALRETVWINDRKLPFRDAPVPITDAQIQDAEDRLRRFAPYIAAAFPETGDGLIESPFQEIPRMREWISRHEGTVLQGRLFLKRDSDLAVSGSVKARGGIYEVLKHAESLAVGAGLLRTTDDYSVLMEPRFREFFSQYKIQVGSTGNLGLSIGLMGAKLGFHVIVHMSVDARQWKKDLLRERGAEVIEYASDYTNAVKEGRAKSEQDPTSYFVDDEKSEDLFLGYATAGKRIAGQIADAGLTVDRRHPLFVYIPCGIGGAPGGVTYGLKRIYGDDVHCFFTEPTEACCMLLGLATGLHNQVCVQDFGISGRTAADGLAVTRPSALVGRIIQPLLSGDITIQDKNLFPLLRALYQTEGIFIEPSSCAGFAAFLMQERIQEYVRREHLEAVMPDAVHVVWATGGSLVPEETRKEYMGIMV